MVILGRLAEDASMSIPSLAVKIHSNTSVVYARVHRLVKLGVIERYTIVINESSLGYTVKARVGINVSGINRGKVIDTLLAINGISGVSEVTGRFDIIITLHARTLDEMHKIISSSIGKIEGVVSTETFIEMKTLRKYMPYVASGAN